MTPYLQNLEKQLPAWAGGPKNSSAGGSSSGSKGSSTGSGVSGGSVVGVSGSITRWVAGAGFRTTDTVPVAFQSLGDLLIYWEMTATNVVGVPYQLSGVSSSVAMSVLIAGTDGSQSAILYMAPASIASCWYYLQNFIGMSAPLKVGPAINLPCSNVVSYVAVSPTGVCGSVLLSPITPDMSQLLAV